MNWLLVFAGFSTLIILHEFGHFIAAKWTGMRVERFFLFFPPKLWSIKRGDTEYGIGTIPLGGFVKITGMNPDDLEPRPQGEGEQGETPNDLLTRIESSGQTEQQDRLPDGSLRPEIAARAYYRQPVWKRIVVIAAGPAMNLVLAFAILFALGFGVKEATTLEVAEIDSDTPAAKTLEEGDELVAIDGVALDRGGSRPSEAELTQRAEAFASQLNTHTCPGEPKEGCVAAKPATLTIERDGRTRTVAVAPTYDPDAPPLEEGEQPGRYRLGFAFEGGDVVDAGYSAGDAANWAVDRIWLVTKGTATVFARIFESEQREQISGVVGISAVGNEVIGFGAWEAFALLALVSLSLAIINLFPFLPLDGGHIFWSLVEKVRGRRPSFAAMERASAIGFVLILFLFFIGLSNDIGRLTGDGFDVR